MRKELFLKFLGGLLVGITIFGSGLYIGKISVSQEEPRTISLTATGEQEVLADTLVLGVKISAFAEDKKEALEKMTGITQDLFEGLKSLGIQEKDLSTRSLQIFPRYDRDCVVILEERLIYPPPSSPKCPKGISGYEASQVVYIKLSLNNQELVLGALQKIVETESVRLWSARFEAKNIEEIKEKARREALDIISRKKRLLKEELGIRFGKVLKYTEHETGSKPFPIIYYKENMEPEEFTRKIIAPEQKTLSVQVSITYELK